MVIEPERKIRQDHQKKLEVWEGIDLIHHEFQHKQSVRSSFGHDNNISEPFYQFVARWVQHGLL